VKIQLRHRMVSSRKVHYATNEDFCRLFANSVEKLYLLSYLLIANREKAEQCFVASLDDCVDGISVFKEWAEAWARRVIVRNAVRLMQPRPGEPAPGICAFYAGDKDGLSGKGMYDGRFAKVLALEDFERFVFVLSVLEGYPDHSCAILLGTSRQEIGATRVRALDHAACPHLWPLTIGVGRGTLCKSWPAMQQMLPLDIQTVCGWLPPHGEEMEP